MAEVSYRKVRENLLAKMEEFRSQGKTALANKLNRIDIALINGQTVEAKKLAKSVKITEIDRITQKLATASKTDKKGYIDVVQKYAQTSKSPGNIAKPKGMTEQIKTLDQLKAFRKSDLGKDILTQAYLYFGEHGNLKGFDAGKELGIVPRKKVRPDKIDVENQRGLGLEATARRKGWQGKRDVTTAIPEDEVRALAKKYNQPDSVVKEFLDDQKNAKKNLEKLINKINTRIGRDNPELLKRYKASLGHGKAASRWDHSADVKSNIELEEFFTNVGRSNKDEISDLFNRSLGRSIDLEEEFLKHLNPELREFAPKMTRIQKDNLINKVRQGMDDPNLKWQGDLDDVTNQPLFKSKEEFLINRELQGLRDASGNLAMDKPFGGHLLRDTVNSKLAKNLSNVASKTRRADLIAQTGTGIATGNVIQAGAAGTTLLASEALQSPAAQKAISKQIAKMAANRAGKTALKSVPGLDVIISGKEAWDYAAQGKFDQAGIAALSGAIGWIPVIGDGASAALDFTNTGIDISRLDLSGTSDVKTKKTKKPKNKSLRILKSAI
tara:strand:+ start:56 stop:1717 length:1662 start_codon:yes stop_codon:yes gene_type:complete